VALSTQKKQKKHAIQQTNGRARKNGKTEATCNGVKWRKTAAPPTRFAWRRRDKRALKSRARIMAKKGTLPGTFIRPNSGEKCAIVANAWCHLWTGKGLNSN